MSRRTANVRFGGKADRQKKSDIAQFSGDADASAPSFGIEVLPYDSDRRRARAKLRWLAQPPTCKSDTSPSQFPLRCRLYAVQAGQRHSIINTCLPRRSQALREVPNRILTCHDTGERVTDALFLLEIWVKNFRALSWSAIGRFLQRCFPFFRVAFILVFNTLSDTSKSLWFGQRNVFPSKEPG